MSLNTIALPLDFKPSARIRADLFHTCTYIRTKCQRVFCESFRALCCIFACYAHALRYPVRMGKCFEFRNDDSVNL